MTNWNCVVHRGVHLLLATLMVLVVACQSSSPPVTEQWIPPYLQLHLEAGKAQVQWAATSEWITMEGQASIVIEDKGQIVADAAEGARFRLGDGSQLELAPETTIEVENPSSLPRLQITLQDGRLLFAAQKPSYEFATSICPVRLLRLPVRISLESNGTTTRLAVEEGAVTCELESETLTLLTCQEIQAETGEEPQVTEFCVVGTEVSPSTSPSAPTPSPSSTPWGFEPSATSPSSPSPPTQTLTPTPTPTVEGEATPTRRSVVPTPTSTPTP
ncbi:MAG: hypothetical protein DRI48_11540, partial [Chloroflexi bacterium]